MSEKLIYPVPEAISKTANIDDATYQRLYRQSLDDPEGFWAEQAQRIDWIEPWQTVKETSFQRNDVSIKWFKPTMVICSLMMSRNLKVL